MGGWVETKVQSKERILICGDRNWNNLALVEETLARWMSHVEVECVIEGEAKGADTQGRIAAARAGIPVLKFPADWLKYGKAAGPIRNRQMLNQGKPTVVLAFHNNIAESKGTADMVGIARAAGLHVEVIREV
jgi:hypothetical protein